MHLQNHPASQSALSKHPVQPYHSEFYQVCRRALDGCVNGDSLCLRPSPARLGVELGQIAAPPVHRRYIARRARGANRLVQPRTHARQPLEVALDVIRGLRQRNPELASQPLGAHPVKNPEFITLASRRASALTLSGVTPSTSVAVRTWMSSPVLNASTNVLSPDRCASTRRSICE